VVSSAIVLMPGLGWVKLRLGRQLGSDATAGEGVQNLMAPHKQSRRWSH
jgi:hypothetical protein